MPPKKAAKKSATKKTAGVNKTKAGLGIRARLTAALKGNYRPDETSQKIRNLRKQAAQEKALLVQDPRAKFPAYGTATSTAQTDEFFNTISPQISPTDQNREGYYPLASEPPVNNQGKRNHIVISRSCAVCGLGFQRAADARYVEHCYETLSSKCPEKQITWCTAST